MAFADPERKREANRAYYAAHREERMEYARKYLANPLNLERKHEYARKYRTDHPLNLERRREWYRLNYESEREYARKRYAKQQMEIGKWLLIGRDMMMNSSGLMDFQEPGTAELPSLNSMNGSAT